MYTQWHRDCRRSTFSLSDNFSRALLGFVIFAYFSLALFARALFPVIIACVGMLATMEAASAWSTDKMFLGCCPCRVTTVYMWYCLVNAGACLALGVSTFTNVDTTCAAAENPGTCSRVAEVVALALCVGATCMGFLAFITSLVFECGTYFKGWDCKACCGREKKCCRRSAKNKRQWAHDTSPCNLEPAKLMCDIISKQKLG